MDSRQIVLRETGIVAIGEAVCIALMLGVYGLLGRFRMAALLGGIAGGVLAIANFFFMAVSTSLAADKAEQQNVKGGQLLIRNSYMLRLVVLFALLFLCAKSGWFDLFALVLPLVFVRPTITAAEFFRKKGEKKA